MTKEDNIFFAKRKLIDNIYKSANLEGIAVTFADTVDFINNVNTGKISVDDMLKLKGLKDADESTRPAKCQELFMTLRGIQAAANDKKAAERYGVPADKADTGVKDAQNTFNAEQNAWNEASKKIKVQG